MPQKQSEKHARQILAQKLRLLRFMRHWSQETLAEAADLHRTYISAVERCGCNIGLDNLEKLARAFDFTLDELLRQPDNGTPTERVLAALMRETKR